MSKMKAYLQLIRFPAVFTALADIFAGYLTAISAFGGGIVWSDLLLLLFASSQVYWAGMVFNDYFDYYTDLKERPERPLPSGAIPRSRALLLGIVFSLLCIIAAGLVSLRSLLIAIILVIAVILYDWATKGIPAIGVFNMGLCRGLNITLGMSVAAPAFIFHKLPIALILILIAYIIFVAQLSKGEMEDSNRIRVIITIVGVAVLAVIMSLRAYGLMGLWALILSAVFLLFVMPSLVRAVKKPIAQNIGRAVKNCLLGIIILDGYFIAGAVGIIFAIFIALSLLIPSILT